MKIQSSFSGSIRCPSVLKMEAVRFLKRWYLPILLHGFISEKTVKIAGLTAVRMALLRIKYLTNEVRRVDLGPSWDGISISIVRNYPHFMGADGSLPCSQEILNHLDPVNIPTTIIMLPSQIRPIFP
jgi:hypothetical protein